MTVRSSNHGGREEAQRGTLRRVFNRHYQLLSCFNYERQMSTGYCYTMLPALRELYKDDERASTGPSRGTFEFFNCAKHEPVHHRSLVRNGGGERQQPG